MNFHIGTVEEVPAHIVRNRSPQLTVSGVELEAYLNHDFTSQSREVELIVKM